MRTIRILGSLRFAIFLIAALAVTLTTSTIFESIYGTPFAQKNFYTAHWFDFLLALFWINIFCAAASRYPFKKRHIGFVITHIGILTLLVGTLLTRILGVEGQMTVYENGTKNQILLPGFTLAVSDEDGKKETLNLKSKAARLPAPIPLQNKDAQLSVSEIVEHAAVTRYLIESDDKKSNPAIHLGLSSALMSFQEKFTLIARDPDNPDSSSRNVGPAHFVLEKESGLPRIKMILKIPGEPAFTVPLESSPKANFPIPGGNLKIKNFHYFEHAKVSENKLTDAPSEIAFNPAVEFDVVDERGRKESHTKFLIFPEYPSLRGGETADVFGLKVSLEAAAQEAESANTPTFHIYPSTETAWRYEIYSSKGLLKKGELRLHDKIETGWRDIQIDVLQMFNRAQIIRKIKPADENTSSFYAVRVTQAGPGGAANQWITEDHAASVETKNGEWNLALEPVKFTLPFELKLKDFRKTDYPGTSSPASFESDVTLWDPVKKISLEKTIRMNEPLDYAGWRIFQASYIQDPEQGEASVFSIAKNPGIKLIYSGGIIILCGVILLFYFHPFFNASLKKD